MRYAHRKFLVTRNVVEEDGVVETLAGSIPVKRGEILLTNEFGDVDIATEEYFNRYYVPVEKAKEKKPEKKLSPFEEQYFLNAYEEMSKLNQIEDEDYINEMTKLVSNKAL